MVNILQQISKTRFQTTIMFFEIVCFTLFAMQNYIFYATCHTLWGKVFCIRRFLSAKGISWATAAQCRGHSLEKCCASQLFEVSLCGIGVMVAG